MRKLTFIIYLLVFVCFSAFGECRYSSLEGQKGTTLMANLQKIIAYHTKLTFDQIRADKVKVDLKSDNSTIWDMYSKCAMDKSDYCGNRTDYDACNCYNREHLLPKSFWNSPGKTDTAAIYTDLFNVIPADFVANTMRSAWIYDEVSGTPTWTNGVSKVGTSKHFSNAGSVFEPADEYKGDIARAYFYLITCYSYMDFTQGGKGFKFFQSGTAKLNSTALSLLLRWHRNDPVSEKERLRNDNVEKKQGNRNPFIDEPVLIEHIWGNKTNVGYKCTATDVDEVSSTSPSSARKMLINGQLYLLYEGTLYTPQGQPVRQLSVISY